MALNINAQIKELRIRIFLLIASEDYLFLILEFLRNIFN